MQDSAAAIGERLERMEKMLGEYLEFINLRRLAEVHAHLQKQFLINLNRLNNSS
jgi:hypothetical protein